MNEHANTFKSYKPSAFLLVHDYVIVDWCALIALRFKTYHKFFNSILILNSYEIPVQV